ncbi:restriction endonuclease subunit S [Zobellella sp. An-6]|uniref:restriction endonuclease subunit S n=1 Tax=Zobellella sp. An-6 TaxID=3400218 RepID=UPI004040FB9C
MSRAQQLITENIATWTGAIQAKSSAGRGGSNKYELYGIKKLRELILELAVRGKLVPQDPNDEPASVLLERIAAEKAELIKQGKIKKSKALPAISDDEKPFELPDGWEWSRLPNTCHYKVGKTPSTKNSVYWTESENGIPWVSISDLNHFGAVEKTAKRVTPVAARDVFKSEPVAAGTILMSFKLTLGKISIINKDAYHNEAIISIHPFSGISKQFIFKVLPQRALAGNSKQAIMGNTLNAESLNSLLIPVPPFSEQHRIVQKIDELMSLCDQLEQQTESNIQAHAILVDTLLSTLTNSADAEELQQSWTRVAGHFDTLFTTEQSINVLKQTILQLAVMGKLVRQNPEDEPASVLLKKIAAEKERLVKEKKIKKQKPLPAMTDDEKPFELPAGWECCRFGFLFKSFSNGIYKPEKFYKETGIISLRMYNIQEGKINFNSTRRVEINEDELEKFSLEENDLLINRVNSKELVGKSAIIPHLNEPLVYESMNMRAKPFTNFLDPFYLNIFMSSSIAKSALFSHAKEAIGQASINQGQISSLITPLPPKNEQHRIVTKVDELMALCDQLKDKLRQSQQTQVHLAGAIVEQALA